MLLALLLGLLTTAANLAGSGLAVLSAHPSRALMANSIAFSGGFILAAALLEMVPEVIKGGHSSMPAMVGVGFLLVYFTEHLGNVHLHSIPPEAEPPPDAGPHASHINPRVGGQVERSPLESRHGLASFAAFNVHDFLDGVAIGAALVADRAVGFLVFGAVLLHELPAGFAISSVIRSAGGSRKAALLAGLSIGVITLIGLVIPFLVEEISDTLTDALLALAAGTFIYLGASILIPAAETGGYRWAFVYVGLGFAVFFGSAELVGRIVGA